MWYSARFSTICTIWKTWKILMEECYFYHKSNTPSWVFFTFFKLHKWYQIAEKHLISHSSHYPHIICQFLFNSDTICSKNGVQRRGFAFQRISVSLVTISADIILIEYFKVITLFNLFHATGIFLYLLKISEIQRFSVFKGYINRPSGMEWVKGPCWSSRPSAFYSWSHDPILKLYWI